MHSPSIQTSQTTYIVCLRYTRAKIRVLEALSPVEDNTRQLLTRAGSRSFQDYTRTSFNTPINDFKVSNLLPAVLQQAEPKLYSAELHRTL